MEFEDPDEEQEEDEEEEEDGIPITSYPYGAASAETRRSSSSCSPPPSPLSLSIPPLRYLECQKNHAAGMGGHAVDGCGEFMPAGAQGSIDAIRCAACNCHRNFHRKEVGPAQNHPPPVFHFNSSSRASPGGHQLALSNTMAALGLGSSGKKRFRTKFTPEHKDKMLDLAERIGWRFDKQHEEAIQSFCHETGLKRKVVKVWMHNNKHNHNYIGNANKS